MKTRLIDFSKYTSLKIGPTIEVVEIGQADIDHIDSKWHIIGRGNNLLISDNPPSLAILSDDFNYIYIKDEQLIIGATTPNGKIFSFCKKHNIRHFEFTRNLPGSLGGMVKMNAGMKDDVIFDTLISIKTDQNRLYKEHIAYDYRHTNIKGVIIEATFDIVKGFDEDKAKLWANARYKQPAKPSAGSCFKNPPGDFAGRLIEAVGLKGYQIGDMIFSPTHANFLTNIGKGSFADAKALITLAQQRIKERFDIELQLEIVML